MNRFVRNISSKSRIEKSLPAGLLLGGNTLVLPPIALLLIPFPSNEIMSEKLLSYKFILSKKKKFKFLIRWNLFELAKKDNAIQGKYQLCGLYHINLILLLL